MANLKATAISIQLGMLNPTPPVSSPVAVLSLGPLQQSDSGLPQADVNIQFSPSHYYAPYMASRHLKHKVSYVIISIYVLVLLSLLISLFLLYPDHQVSWNLFLFFQRILPFRLLAFSENSDTHETPLSGPEASTSR